MTLVGLFFSMSVPVLAALGGGWALLACAVLVSASVLDGVDGAVAGLTGTASAWGEVLDSTEDRISDLLLISTLVLLGAPVWLGVALAAARSGDLVNRGLLTVPRHNRTHAVPEPPTAVYDGRGRRHPDE